MFLVLTFHPTRQAPPPHPACHQPPALSLFQVPGAGQRVPTPGPHPTPSFLLALLSGACLQVHLVLPPGPKGAGPGLLPTHVLCSAALETARLGLLCSWGHWPQQPGCSSALSQSLLRRTVCVWGGLHCFHFLSRAETAPHVPTRAGHLWAASQQYNAQYSKTKEVSKGKNKNLTSRLPPTICENQCDRDHRPNSAL